MMPTSQASRDLTRTPPRNCPKGLGCTHSIALRTVEKAVLRPFRAPYTAKFSIRWSVARTLFGQLDVLRQADKQGGLGYHLQGGQLHRLRSGWSTHHAGEARERFLA